MDRMKTFFKYVILITILYVFSNIIINALLKISYTKITDYQIDVKEIYVDIDEAKVSKWNGNIKGIVKNNSEEVVENKYLKISMLSENNRTLGEKYVKIDKLEQQQLKNFEVDFDYDNVKTFKIELTDTIPEKVDFFELVVNNVKDIKNNVLK